MDLENLVLDTQFGMKTNKMIVSVWMVTYNHEDSIAQAVESVMMQETNFNYKLFIGEDCSKDSTREICINLQEKYPDKIELILQKNNIGPSKNAQQVYKACFESGAEYIAMLEGDDYWTDPHKLQKQVDFLRNNKECIFSFHKSFRVFGTDEPDYKNIYPKGIKQKILDEKEFFKIPTIPTASVLFSNQIKFPEIYHIHGDFLLYCTLLSSGKAGFIDEPMSVYKLHGAGVSSTYDSNSYLERRINELKIEGQYYGFSRNVRKQINKILTEHIEYYLNKNRGHLSLSDKISYIKILLSQKAFYSLSPKKYVTLAKTMFK